MLLMNDDIQDLQAERRELRLKICEDGMLQMIKEGATFKVKVHRCFPWSEPLEYLSLRDLKNKERALVKNLSDLDDESQKALLQAIAESQFCFEIERVVSVTEEYEVRTWVVETKQGKRRFQTKLDEWPRHVPGGAVIIRDVHGDLYLMSRREGLPEMFE